MGKDSDSSTDDEHQSEGVKSGQSSSDSNNDKIISHLILSIVERLTKITVICEGNSTSDSSSIKTLMKQIYKFEKSLKKLQKTIQHNIDNSLDNGTVIKGLIRAVDNYDNPYDWLYKNITDKCSTSMKMLDNKLTFIHNIQQGLIERLNISDTSMEI